MEQPVEKNELRILLLEDMPSDAALEESQLRDAGLTFSLRRVDTRVAFEQALDEFQPDIILADYNLPAYNGREALLYSRRTHPQVPFIIVTGSLGDEAAVELLKLGARDYVLKDHMARLAPVLKRAISEEHSIRNRKLAEGKYHALFTDAMDGIVLIDCDTSKVVDCNAEFERQTGRTLEQIKEMKAWDVLSPEKHELARQKFLDIVKTGSGHGSDFELHGSGGKIIPIEYTAKLLNIQGQHFIQAITRDITERKQAERALQENEARYRRITEGLTDYQYTVRIENGRPVETRQSPACAMVTGYTAEEFAANPLLWIQMVAPEDRERVLKHTQQVLSGEDVPPIEHRILRKNGETRWISDTIILFKDASGKLLSYDGVIKDISERKQAEAELLRLNRTLRALSAGNHALVHAENEKALLENMCRATLEGDFVLAWVGYAMQDDKKSIVPMAVSGNGKTYVEALNITWDDQAPGREPIGAAVCTGQTQIARDIKNDPRMEPWREAAMKYGYASSIALPLLGAGQVIGALTIYAAEPDAFGPDQVALLEEMASDLAFGIGTLRIRIAHEQHATILRQSLEQSIQTIAGTVEARDPYTAGHQRRVSELATAIAREMGLPEEQVNGIHFAAIIHDLGKIHIPAEILAKPGKLIDIELMLIKTHPQAGYNILKNVKFPWPIADIILQHHEKLDGSGYPQGLKKGQILLESRIMTVADVVEAMSSHRPYRPALGIEAALSEIARGRGSVYDPAIVDACLRLFAIKKFTFSGSSPF